MTNHIGRVMTLEPCDIIVIGTTASVAAFMKPEPRFLPLGDLIDVDIENV